MFLRPSTMNGEDLSVVTCTADLARLASPSRLGFWVEECFGFLGFLWPTSTAHRFTVPRCRGAACPTSMSIAVRRARGADRRAKSIRRFAGRLVRSDSRFSDTGAEARRDAAVSGEAAGISRGRVKRLATARNRSPLRVTLPHFCSVPPLSVGAIVYLYRRVVVASRPRPTGTPAPARPTVSPINRRFNAHRSVKALPLEAPSFIRPLLVRRSVRPSPLVEPLSVRLGSKLFSPIPPF